MLTKEGANSVQKEFEETGILLSFDLEDIIDAGSPSLVLLIWTRFINLCLSAQTRKIAILCHSSPCSTNTEAAQEHSEAPASRTPWSRQGTGQKDSSALCRPHVQLFKEQIVCFLKRHYRQHAAVCQHFYVLVYAFVLLFFSWKR